jgi:hypothetical protein
MIGEIQPPLDLIKQRPSVFPIRFSFDFVDIPFSREANKQIDKIIDVLGHLNEKEDLNDLIDTLSDLEYNFVNKIPAKDYNLLPADFNFEDQFGEIKKGDILIFEYYYDDYEDKYGGPMFFVLNNFGKVKNVQIVPLQFNGNFYILPSEAAPIVARNEGASLDGVKILYPTIDIEAITLSKDLNLKDEYGHKIFGTYMLASSAVTSIIILSEDLLYLGDKISS